MSPDGEDGASQGGTCQALYMSGLAWAYARGDVSLLYPMARALPVLWVPAVALLVLPTPALDLDDSLGMGLIAISALIMPLTHWRAFRLESYLTPRWVSYCSPP